MRVMLRTRQRLIVFLLVIGLLNAMSTAMAASREHYSVRITAPASLVPLLTHGLSLITEKADPDMDATLLASLVRETPHEAKALLETEGYFDAQVSVVTEPNNQFIVKVEPGEPVLIDDVVLSVVGPIRSEPDFQQRFAALLEAWPLPIGANYRQDEWDDGKKTVLRLLSIDRFPLATITYSRADIDPKTKRSRLEVVVDSGPRIVFGPLVIQGLQRYPAQIVEGMADFHRGGAYKLQKLFNYQTALEQSPYFSSVIVSADLQKINDDQVPVMVGVSELPAQKIELGLSYDTGVGAGARIGYDHYNIFQRGYTGSILWDWAQFKQIVSFGLSFPKLSNSYSHSITAAFKKTELNSVITTALSAGVWRIRSHGKIEARLGFEYISNKQQITDQVPTVTYAFIPSYGWTRRAVDDLKRPRSGTLVDIKVSGAPGGRLSSTAFVRGYGRGAVYWTPLAAKWGTWLLRGEVGQVFARNTDQVPSSLLFLAGGVNSVRGYDYQSLGVLDKNGISIVGGSVLATASIEYQFPLTRDWLLAVFRDMGNASQRWNTFTFDKANGVGVRWMSPIAPLAFDIAKGDRYRWYFSLGLIF